MLIIYVKKCSFMKIELVYLGFFIFVEGLNMDPKNVREIMEWPKPTRIKEVRYFHELTRFHRMFIMSFNFICTPLTKNEGNWEEFKWTSRAQKSLNC